MKPGWILLVVEVAVGCGTPTASSQEEPARCGNGVVELGETCDGHCPKTCDDKNACTSDWIVGSARECTLACRHVPVERCVGGDGCCPSACDANRDSDCKPVYGNGVIEDGEQCDTGGELGEASGCLRCRRTGTCAVGNGGCASEAQCRLVDGSVTCTCKSGYEGDVKSCTDIDECAAGTADCDAHASCTNTPGSYAYAVTTAFGERLEYDAVGQLREYNGFRLQFDVEGRLVQAVGPDGTSLQWFYDFAGQRRTKVSEKVGQPTAIVRYPFPGYEERDGEPLWRLEGGGGVIAEVVETSAAPPSLLEVDEAILRARGDGMPPPLELDRESAGQMAGRYWNEARGAKPVEVARYYHADQLGGTSYTTDSGGRLVSFTRWHPYGTVRGARGSQPHHTFAGGQREEESELGLVQFGARWYAPRLGRWVSPDPLYLADPSLGLKKPFNLSLYAYASNSPLSFVDPGGLDPDEPQEKGLWERFKEVVVQKVGLGNKAKTKAEEMQMALGREQILRQVEGFEGGTVVDHEKNAIIKENADQLVDDTMEAGKNAAESWVGAKALKLGGAFFGGVRNAAGV